MENYLAGKTRDEALERARHLNKEGLGTLLAPHFHRKGGLSESQRADRATEEVEGLIKAMGMKLIRGGLSLDPKDFDIESGWARAMERLTPLVVRAEEYGYGVWLEAEDPETAGAALDLYLGLRPRFPHLGITLSARLPRALSDLATVTASRGRVRLVKGLPDGGGEPDETPEVREVRDDLNGRYRLLLEILFRDSNFFAIATHDPELIEEAHRLSEVQSRMFEFQLYMGVSDALARRLVYERGHPTTIYLPYGEGTGRHMDRLVRGGRVASSG
ncbi:MAG: proline dehydrogenase family protein [Leptospirillia bacterium]